MYRLDHANVQRRLNEDRDVMIQGKKKEERVEKEVRTRKREKKREKERKREQIPLTLARIDIDTIKSNCCVVLNEGAL